MIYNLQIGPKTVRETTTVSSTHNETIGFPILNIGVDSYIVSSQIHTSLDLNQDYTHSIHIGKYCSIATNMTMMIDLNHDYKSITTSAASFLRPHNTSKLIRKGQIIIQNDVWIGNQVILMSGIKIGNGAVIGAGTVVSKDIPPYAIAVGNPCKIIKYRFTDEQIEKLQLIRWWDFEGSYLNEISEYFTSDVDVFIDKFYPHALAQKKKLYDLNLELKKTTYLFFPDFYESFSVWKNVITSYCTSFSDKDDVSLLIYIDKTFDTANQINCIDMVVSTFPVSPDIYLVCDSLSDERLLFMQADYFITSRCKETVQRTTFADEFSVKVLSGADIPIFNFNKL